MSEPTGRGIRSRRGPGQEGGNPFTADDSHSHSALLLLALLVLSAILLAHHVTAPAPGPGTLLSGRDAEVLQPGGLTPERVRLLGRLLDVNTASVGALSKVRGIGPRFAPDVVALRDRRGGFSRIEDLLDVRGIGPRRLEIARKYLEVRPERPSPRSSSGAPAPHPSEGTPSRP